MSTTQTRADELREARHPVFSDRALRLGTFSSNLSHGCAISTIDGVLTADWPSTMSLARMGDEMSFEALVPVGRWRGFGGVTDFNGAGFESFTWAAGVGGATERAGIFATSHVPTIHPILAAKQGATVDHITQGRFALNVVTGWHKPEIEMFGAPILPHDERYSCAGEWLEIIRRLWSEDEPLDFEGRYYKVEGAVVRPRPLQRPHPVIMNAGGSDTGRHFAARECDVAFVIPDAHDFDGLKARVDHYRELARDEYGRELQVWTYAYVVQGDTERDAQAYLHRYVHELGDWDAVDNLVSTMGMNAKTLPPEVLTEMKVHFIAGWGGYPAVGTSEQVVEHLATLVRAGFDGVLLSWPRYVEDMRRFQAETYPLLVDAGLRG
jgi:dimethylsulfone monooxygenase